MIKPPLLNEDEWHALRDFDAVAEPPSALQRQAWHWYNTRVTMITLVVFAFAGVLLSFPTTLAMKFDISPELQTTYRDYFVLRGWLLAVYGIVGLWAWCRDRYFVQVQGFLLLIALVTFAIDSVLIYGHAPEMPGTGFTMGLLARILAIGLLAINMFRQDALPPVSECKILWWYEVPRAPH